MFDSEKIEPYANKKYKGVRDFYPDKMQNLRRFLDISCNTARQHGFEEYSASPLEYSSLYKKDTSENAQEDIYTKELYTFTDKGDDEVSLRPEMTPTLKRMASNVIHNKKYSTLTPMKWFSTPNVFRYERSQRGRSREHYQFNADIIGPFDIWADVEILSITNTLLKNLGLNTNRYTIQINDRGSVVEALLTGGIMKENFQQIFRIIDKRSKLGETDFIKSMDEIDKNAIKVFQKYCASKPKYINEIIGHLGDIGIEIEFKPELMRGFDYYTGLIFEVFSTDKENTRSICGGGRYDEYINVNETYYGAVGVGVGDQVVGDILEGITPSLCEGELFDVAIISGKNNHSPAFKAQSALQLNNISSKLFFLDEDLRGKLYKELGETTRYCLLLDGADMSTRDLKDRKDTSIKDIDDFAQMIKEKNG